MRETLADAKPISELSVRANKVPPALGVLLRELRQVLRQAGDAFMYRRVESLCEGVAVLDPPVAVQLNAATQLQRAAIAKLLQPTAAAAGGLELLPLLRSVECAVDMVSAAAAETMSQFDPAAVRLQLSEHDLAASVRDCCAAFEALANERELVFAVRVPRKLPVVADAAKLQRVVLNLLFNAFKLTPQGGRIDVTVAADTALGEAEISVVDSGRGVNGRMGDALFSRWRSADRTGPSGADWLGFDLGTSRDLMRLHGGELRCVPRPDGEGAEFRAHLPVAPLPGPVVRDLQLAGTLPKRVARVAAQELATEDRLGDDAAVMDHRPLVLVIEDSRMVQRVVAEALSDRCNIATAVDGATGLRLAVERKPDLIITDLGLPELDGCHLVRAIRNHRALDSVPILVVSGRHEGAGTVDLLRAGAQDFMSKPFLVRELQARAHNLLEAKRARDVLGDVLGERETDLGRMAAEVTREQRRLQAALEQLREAREIAEGANRVKSNFLRMMSHELKTPVTALLLQLQILNQDSLIATGPRRVRDALASMGRSISRLIHIVDTVLEWARVESGRYRTASKSLELAALARRAVDEVKPQAERKQVVIDVSVRNPVPAVESDGELLELILVNLLERAIMVTNDGVISVTIWYEGGKHRVRVIDNGPALSPQEQRDLFDVLDPRLDLQRGGGYGSGLGLHVVRDLARAIGAELDLAAEWEDGRAVDLMLVSAGGTEQVARNQSAISWEERDDD